MQINGSEVRNTELIEDPITLDKPDDFRYIKVPGLSLASPELTPTGKRFWVGVTEKVYPSKPVLRYKTNSYTPARVYNWFGRLLFALPTTAGGTDFDFYYIPDYERRFIQ